MDAAIERLRTDHPHQAIIDALAEAALIGTVDWYRAKDAVAREDWELAEQLLTSSREKSAA